MYECPSCGAGLIFDPTTQKLKCHYCNQQFEMQELEKLKSAKGEKDLKIEATNEEQAQTNVYEAIVYRCTQCGAELITTDETISTFCSYCGSSAVLERRNTKKTKPDYIIPFTKTKEECEIAYKKKLSKAFFAPSNMSDEQQIEKIRGIYMPYWIYSFEKIGPDVARGKKYKCRRGDYIYYRDFDLKTNIKAEYSGITHDASSNFSDSLSEAIAPFSVKEKKEFNPAYLSGFYADAEDVEKNIYMPESNAIASNDFYKKLMKDKTYIKYNAVSTAKMDSKSVELGLFPVYFLATKNEKGDRISYAVVNGQTGKVAAEIPMDFKKYLITSLILAIPIFLLLNGSFTITPIKVLITSIIFSVLSLIISGHQLSEINEREKKLDDKGFLAKNKERVYYNDVIQKSSVKKISKMVYACILLFAILGTLSAGRMGIGIIFTCIIGASVFSLTTRVNTGNDDKIKKSDKLKRLTKPIIGIIVSILIIILKPVSDIYYYAAAIFSIAMVILSFWDIVKGLNLLTTRKLPQLEKRGGDENE